MIENEFENNVKYEDVLIVNMKDIANDTTYLDEWRDEYDYFPYPFVVIKCGTNMTGPIGEYDIDAEYIMNVIGSYLKYDII